jgi:hypothetical protein
LQVECLEDRTCPTLLAPALSSLPGADHTIYLQFTGGTTQNTRWNTDYNLPSIDSPAYDIDGNPGSFSAVELGRITEVFNRVAEAFIPFNVNVTTVDPGAAALQRTDAWDTQWGIRVIITEDTLGVASIGSIDSNYYDSFNWSDGSPAFVFASGQMRPSGLAMTICHVVGHTMGLKHHGNTTHEYETGFGTGPTSWAPIMGAGFGQSVLQWSNGAYYDSNSNQDDLAIITSQNGFGYRPDDHGDTNSDATALTMLGSYGTGSGIIEQNTDVDVFSFVTGAGLVTLNGKSFTPGSVLKVKMDLYDSTGHLIASSNPDDSMDAQISANLSAGTYFIHISGGATGTPLSSTPSGFSNYGSLGRYTISVQAVDPSNRPTIIVSDTAAYNSSGKAYFPINLTGIITSAVTVNYSTSPGTAAAGADYTTSSGSLTFLPGQPTRYIAVPIVNSAQYEPTETFFVNLSTPTQGVILGRSQATCMIYSNVPAVSISNNGMAKPTSGQSTMTFNVGLTQPSTHVVTVDYALVDGTAVAGVDYVFSSGTLTFQPGQTAQTITVTINGNTTLGINSFYVQLSNVSNATLLDPLGIGTIVDEAQRLRYLMVVADNFSGTALGGALPLESVTSSNEPLAAADQFHAKLWRKTWERWESRHLASSAKTLSLP